MVARVKGGHESLLKPALVYLRGACPDTGAYHEAVLDLFAAGTSKQRVHSMFIERMNRSTMAMLPCLPTAPYRGRIVRLLHHFLNASQSNCFPLSAMTYFGFTPLFLIAVFQVSRA